jgi:hypothetical protein
VPLVSEGEVKAAYESARPRFPNKTREELRPQLEAALRDGHSEKRRAAYITELRTRAGVRSPLEPPRIEVDAAGGEARGPSNAPVTIVEFSDPSVRTASGLSRRSSG